jgi:hypothetical protein
VRDSDDFGVFTAYSVHETERVERKNVATGVRSVTRPRVRIGGDDIDRMAQFFAKA